MRVPIIGYEGFYEICDSGRVFSLDRITTGLHGSQKCNGKEIKPIKHKKHGYYLVNLAKEGKVKQYRLHVLVAKHFIPNPENKPTVNHKLGDKSLNSKNDLEWATHQEQMDHAVTNGLTASGMRNGGNKLSDDEVLKAFADCMAGAELIEISAVLNVNRNTLPKAFKRLGLGEAWAAEAASRKTKASLKRWTN